VIFITLLAKWVARRSMNLSDEDVTIDEVLEILLFNNGKYIVGVPNDETLKSMKNIENDVEV